MEIKRDNSLQQFLLRLAGVTGFFVGVAGLVLWLVNGDRWAMYLGALGGALFLIALIIDVPVLMQGVRSQRGAVGGTVVLQIALALVLFIGVNVFSFFHYSRLDLTRDERFTLDPALRRQLAKLDQETTIVVFQRHTSFGQSAENPPDNYDAAAERQIVEKVRDLAELFQDLGPRFRVELLDIHDDYFQDRLQRYKEEKPDLARAIEAVKENSIFFYAPKDPSDSAQKKGYVQVISFNDIFQLDRKASRDENGGKRNLVLRDQGVNTFANKILNIQEKRPKIAFAVAHEYLGVKGHRLLWGMPGVEKVLDARGMEFQDIVLKKFEGGGPPAPAVLTHEESKYERAEFVIAELESRYENQKETHDDYAELEKDFSTLSEEELNKKYFFLALKGRPMDIFSEPELKRYEKTRGWREGRDYARVDPVKHRITPDIQRAYLEGRVRPILREAQQAMEILEAKLKGERASIGTLNVEHLSEQKRISDLRAKFNRMLADADLLVVPRLTLIDALIDPRPVPYKLHALEDAQVAAIKDFIRSGRPVLFCMDPPFEETNFVDEKGDGVDALLRELGVAMPAQTVLFDVEVESLIQGKGSGLLMGQLAEVPPASFESKNLSVPRGLNLPSLDGKPHPIRESLLVAGRSLSTDLPPDLRLRNPRPVYRMKPLLTPKAVATTLAEAFTLNPLVAVSPAAASYLPDPSAVVLSTAVMGWNTDKPFAEDEIPKYAPSGPDDPNTGTWNETRRGPFPVAIAFETRVPESWLDAGEVIRTVRVGVIGDGEIFKGENLTPMKEKLLLDYANWLLGRDDLLARQTGQPWSFLRVDMSDGAKGVWVLTMWMGLPLLFVYIGTIVMLKRRLR